jgi:Fe-S cluster biogenesis protein NfuA
MQDDAQLTKTLARVEALVHEAENLPDEGVRNQVQELVQHLLDYHGAALGRMFEHVAGMGEEGRKLIDAWSQDELIGSLLLLYNLHPRDLESRVLDALERARPYLKSHGGNVEFLGLVDGVVRLRLQGHCHGCPSSAVTLRTTIEKAIYEAAPDVAAIEVDGEPAAPLPTNDFVPLEQLTTGVKIS